MAKWDDGSKWDSGIKWDAGVEILKLLKTVGKSIQSAFTSRPANTSTDTRK